MKIDFAVQLKKDDGSLMFDEVLNKEKTDFIESGTPFTLKLAASKALLATIKDENADGEEKYKRFKIRERLNEDDVVDLKTDEIAKIKTLIGKVYSPLVVGQCWELLEKEKVKK